MQLFSLFKGNKLYILIYFAFVLSLLSLAIFALTKLPGNSGNHLACFTGGNLSSDNILFLIIFLSLLGFGFIGFLEIVKKRVKIPRSSSLGIISVIIGSLASFCSLCILPAISLAGFSIGLSFFYEYSLAIKILAIIMLIISLIFLELHLRKVCLFNNCDIT